MSPYVYIYIKHNTTWKVPLCSVFTHSLFLYQNFTRSLRSLVRFLIRQFELVRSYGTSGVSINCCIVNHPVKQVQQL